MALAGATVPSLAPSPALAQTAKVEAHEHWVMKGDVKLYVYRKQAANVIRDGRAAVLFLVHGSTLAGRGSYDLIVPGRTGYSAMDHFAGLGYDVWTMDHEGYGFSSRTASHAGIRVGVEDLKAVMPLIEKVTGKKSVLMFGQSSGAIRAGVFAVEEPSRVERLILHAYTHTGQNAPEIERRRKQVDVYKANPRRPFGLANVESIFSRDVVGKADPVVTKALADFELQFGNTVPSGAYLDMAINLPMFDPAKLTCPTCLIRPEHDGNASEAELFEFFQKLGAREKQFLFVDGMTHGGGMVGPQRQRLWHMVQSFISLPAATS